MELVLLHTEDQPWPETLPMNPSWSDNLTGSGYLPFVSIRTLVLSCGAVVWVADESTLPEGKVGSSDLLSRDCPSELQLQRPPWFLQASCLHLLLCVVAALGELEKGKAEDGTILMSFLRGIEMRAGPGSERAQ